MALQKCIWNPLQYTKMTIMHLEWLQRDRIYWMPSKSILGIWKPAGFLKSPNRTRIPKSGGASWHLYRGYVGAGATVVVIASLPDEEWRQDGKLCLYSHVTVFKAVRWPQIRCNEIFCNLCDGRMLERKSLHNRPPLWALAFKRYTDCEHGISNWKNSRTKKAWGRNENGESWFHSRWNKGSKREAMLNVIRHWLPVGNDRIGHAAGTACQLHL